MTILPEGNYTNTLSTIRHFQYEGKVELKLVDGPTLVNNDRVLLESKQFLLNYTPHSSESLELLITIEDNYGTRWEQTFEFNNNDSDDNGGYGHMKLPGEKYYKGYKMSEREADALLRKDLHKFCAPTIHCRYKGRFHRMIHERRMTEFAALFVP